VSMSSVTPRGSATLAVILTASLLVVGAGLFNWYLETAGIFLRKIAVYPEEPMHTLPERFGCWQKAGSDQVLTKEAVEELGTDNYLTRTYLDTCDETERSRPRHLVLQLSYYTGMIDTAPHVPERCNVSAGQQQVGPSETLRVPIDMSRLIVDTGVSDEMIDALGGDGYAEQGGEIYMGRDNAEVFTRVRLPARVENLRMRITPFRDHDGSVFYAGYFFLANGGSVASSDGVRQLAFQLEDDYAYYAKVQFNSRSVDSAEGLAALAGAFLDEAFPAIMRRVPDWIEVRRGNVPEKPGSPAVDED
jgi:hypothetical protein